jgi:hypothetical protein
MEDILEFIEGLWTVDVRGVQTERLGFRDKSSE